MTEDTGETFGQWLRRTRKEKGFTQESLAVAAGNICTSAYISSLEREQEIGKSGRPIRPDVSIVDALAKALNVPVSIARKKAGYDPGLSHLPSPRALGNGAAAGGAVGRWFPLVAGFDWIVQPGRIIRVTGIDWAQSRRD